VTAPTPSDPSPPSRAGSLVDWLFRNRETGGITVAQAPNPPLAILLVTIGLRLVVPDGSSAESALGWIGLGALAWLALDEVVRGVNPWRRLLGLGGCLLVISGLVARLG
jgi:hypothetical protein